MNESINNKIYIFFRNALFGPIFFAVILLALPGVILYFAAPGFTLPTKAVFYQGLCLSLVMADFLWQLVRLLWSHQPFLYQHNASKIARSSPGDYKEAFAIFDQVSSKIGLNHAVDLAVSPCHITNAFACGLFKKRSLVIVTQGALANLTIDQLGALFAHELAHVKNSDFAKNFKLRALLNLAIPIYLPIFYFYSLGPSTIRTSNFTSVLVSIGLYWLCRQYIEIGTNYYMRRCEIRADICAAKVTSKDTYVDFLISLYYEKPASFIQIVLRNINPKVWIRLATFGAFQTHPKCSKRIKTIEDLEDTPLQTHQEDQFVYADSA